MAEAQTVEVHSVDITDSIRMRALRREMQQMTGDVSEQTTDKIQVTTRFLQETSKKVEGYDAYAYLNAFLNRTNLPVLIQLFGMTIPVLEVLPLPDRSFQLKLENKARDGTISYAYVKVPSLTNLYVTLI